MSQEDELFEQYMKRPIAYRAELAKAIGSVKLAVLLSQLYYWSDKGHDPDGWIYKTREQIFDETGLSRQEQETARKWGREAGVLEEVKKGIPRKIYFKINKSAIVKVIQNYMNGDRPPSRRKSPLQAVINKADKQANHKPAIYTETTTKTNSETTHETTASAAVRRQRFFTKRFFKQAKEWNSSFHRTKGIELKSVLDWMTKNYGEKKAVEELEKFIHYWTTQDSPGEWDEPFMVYDRIKGWMKELDKVRG